MRHEIRLTPDAEEQLIRIASKDDELYIKILEGIDGLASGDPRERKNVKNLQPPLQNWHRLRVDHDGLSYRIAFRVLLVGKEGEREVKENESVSNLDRIVEITWIGKRSKNTYQRLNNVRKKIEKRGINLRRRKRRAGRKPRNPNLYQG